MKDAALTGALLLAVIVTAIALVHLLQLLANSLPLRGMP